jgi:hypothetical protein
VLAQFFYSIYDTPEAMPHILDTRYAALLSPDALAFFKHALVVDWRQRPTPAQLLQHPYLSSGVSSSAAVPHAGQ